MRKFSGEPYFEHPERVAELVIRTGGARTYDVMAALLHDVVEDTPVTLDHLRHIGYPAEVVEMVDNLTKREGEERKAFIRRAGSHRGSWLIKRADLLDNLSTLPPSETSMMRRYVRDLDTLNYIAWSVNGGSILREEATP